MTEYVRVQLYTDQDQDSKLSYTQNKEQADRNARWRDKIADPSNPTYVVFRPDLDRPFDAEDNLQGKALGIERGKIFNVPAFVNFLREPLQAQANPNQAVALR